MVCEAREKTPDIGQEAAPLYDRCHPDDSFLDLKRRAAFSKEDRMLLRDWLAAVTGIVSKAG